MSGRWKAGKHQGPSSLEEGEVRGWVEVASWRHRGAANLDSRAPLLTISPSFVFL